MRFVLLTVFAFLAASFTATAAQPGPPLSPTPDKVVKVGRDARGEAAARMTLDASQKAVKIKARHPAPESRPVAQTAVSAPSEADDSDGVSYGTLLATLILMAAIAVRRSKAGRP